MTPADAASMCDAQVERLDEAGPERSSFGLERRAEQRLGVAAARMSSPEPRPAIRFDRIDQLKPTPLAPVVHDYIFGDTVTGLIGASRACKSRSEERRVGQECVSKCGAGWSPSNSKQQEYGTVCVERVHDNEQRYNNKNSD